MKKQLLATTALAAAGAVALSAGAMAQGMKPTLTVNGQIEYSVGIIGGDGANDGLVQVGKNDDGSPITKPNDRTGIDVKSDNEIHFNAGATLDNGIKIAARVELEGFSTSYELGATHNDQIDEAWIRASGSFGQIQMGTMDPVSRRMTFGYLGSVSTSVGHNLTMFNAPDWIPNPAGVNVSHGRDLLADYASDAESIAYYTPRFSGLQLGASYARDQSEDDNATRDGTGNATYLSTGATNKRTLEKDIIGLGVNYVGKFGDVGVGAAFGYQTASLSNIAKAGIQKKNKDGSLKFKANGTPDWDLAPGDNDPTAINAGLRIDVQNIRVGVGYMEKETRYSADTHNGWDAGIRYKFGANSAGLNYLFGEDDAGRESTATQVAFARTLGPGVTWSLSFIWADWDSGNDLTSAEGTAISSGLKIKF